jgi:ATP-dependent DNA helicase RecQ
MGLREDVLAACEGLLAATPDGLTAEALLRSVAQRVGQQLPLPSLTNLLRSLPERFVEGEDGRWRLRERSGVLIPEDADAPFDSSSSQPTVPAHLPLKRGCYVVFDLEATGPHPTSPETQIIQIAAQRWIDGQPQEPWVSFVRTTDGKVPSYIARLTQITSDELQQAPAPADALRAFFDYVGDLPLIAHNGASYDGPLVAAVCARLELALPATFQVLDTLPLARVLLPIAPAHTVSALAEHFGCLREDAHRADADVEMLGGVVFGLQQVVQSGVTGAAVYELLRRSGDPWAEVLAPPDQPVSADQVIATFGAHLAPLLPERGAAAPPPTLDAVFTQAIAQGLLTERPPQKEMAELVESTFRAGGYTVIEAPTGVGKSRGYLIPAALAARASGRPVAISTLTRVLQTQLVERELPFIQTFLPDLTYAMLQGRANYLSLSRLAEEVEDALAEASLPVARAWMLGALVRFAEASADGNLEILGYIPQTLDDYLGADGAALQVLNSVRASEDDGHTPAGLPDFYRHARANADRADLVIVNHALLLNILLTDAEEDAAPFASWVICDEAHTLEQSATDALEQRVDETALRRLLRALHDPQKRAGLVVAWRRVLGLPARDPALAQLAEAVDNANAALDSLTRQLRRYVDNQTVVARSDLERYGVQVSIESTALSAAGGPDLRAVAETFGSALEKMQQALRSLVESVPAASAGALSARQRRVLRLAGSLRRDLRTLQNHYRWFWSFRDSSRTVRIVELGRIEPAAAGSAIPALAPVSLSGKPINVGPLLWERLWSRLDAAVYTSATLSVYGQGFDFFLGRIGLEPVRVQTASPAKAVTTRALDAVFNYHEQSLLMLPNDLPAPRDSELKRNFPEAVANLLQRFIPFFKGRTLGLFTANSRRDYVYKRIAGPLTEAGYPVLSQGEGSTQRLLAEFRDHPEQSLLGSLSLWEGVDVPGESLSYLFLEKLPYPSMAEPIEAARMSAVEAAGGDPFYSYLLPRMIMELKQGFGRLIRSATDHGAAILLDKRLRSAMYKIEVLRSLPNPTIGYESGNELFQRIANWMDLPFDPADLPAPTVSDLARVLAEQELSSLNVSEADFESVARSRLLAVQRAIWGQETFRPGQEEIIRAVLAGKDVLTLLPTGAGKSRTYQLPALIRPGLTLVISPLIALIRDQVEKLREVPGMTCTAALISGMDAASQEEVLRAAVNNQLKLLYISPERLRDPRFRAYLPRLRLVQLVVDEAHCISTWGHDFRPDFLDISRLLPASTDGNVLPVHALTATATSRVQQEIISSLDMGTAGREVVTLSGDFVRENLIFRVYRTGNQRERDARAVGIVCDLVRNQVRGGAGIVYVATRRQAVQLARLLRDRNIAAQAYHAGMDTPLRHQIQERFMQGELDVVVATPAFGMGVDKSEIRFVLHYDHPASLEAYAQEAGRAGRDGKEAYAILLDSFQTRKTHQYLARRDIPSQQKLQAYRRALLSVVDEPDDESDMTATLPDGTVLCDPEDLTRLAGVESVQGRVLLFSFEEAGLLQRGPDCTLEATLLLNQPASTILDNLGNAEERALARAIFELTGADIDRQGKYRALAFYAATGLDPRKVDPLLNRLAEQEWLLYRPYARGITLGVDRVLLGDKSPLQDIEQRFASRYKRFEDRMQAMLDYIHLRSGQGHCRSAEIINYLTGRSDALPCGKCDLCSPTDETLPWDAGVHLYGEPLSVDPALAILGAVRDHNDIFSARTIKHMLLGIPQTVVKGETKPLSRSAHASDHFEELKSSGITGDRFERTLNALIEAGFLQLHERVFQAKGITYSAVKITQKGRDALAGGIALPTFKETEVSV